MPSSPVLLHIYKSLPSDFCHSYVLYNILITLVTYTVQSTSVPEKKNDNISNEYTVQSTSVLEKKYDSTSNECSSSAVIGLSVMSCLLIVTLAIIIVIQCLLMVRMKKTNDMMWRNKTNAKAITPTAMMSDISLTPNEAYALHKINKTSEEVLYDTMK